jgi:hypothetical protein
LAAVAFIAAMFIHNVRLTDEQSLDDDVLDDMNGLKKPSVTKEVPQVA